MFFCFWTPAPTPPCFLAVPSPALASRLIPLFNTELVGFDGNRTTTQAVDLDMIFLQRAFRGRYLLIDEDRGILGRDVLANVSILLNGPAQEWSQHL
jgi:hypothetical protein